MGLLILKNHIDLIHRFSDVLIKDSNLTHAKKIHQQTIIKFLLT